MNTTTNNKERCVGNCPNTCKVHMGEYQFCTNEGCKCHLPQTTTKDWEKEFISKFFVYRLKGDNQKDHVGAQHDAVDFISSLIEFTKQEERKKVLEGIYLFLQDCEDDVEGDSDYERGQESGYDRVYKYILNCSESQGIDLSE